MSDETAGEKTTGDVVGAAIDEAHAKADATTKQTHAAVDDLTAAADTVLERLRERARQRAGLRLVKAATK